ncbi:MAG: metallophosphoesterase [Bacteroidales bacterium]
MRSQIRYIFFFFVAFILLVDGISFAGLAGDFPAILHPLSIAGFWVITLIFIVRLSVYGRVFLSNSKPGFFAGFYVFTGFFLAFYVPKLFYIAFLIAEFASKPLIYPVLLLVADPLPFGEFLWTGPLNIISMLVIPLSALSMMIFFWGMLFGRFNFKVRRSEITYTDIPPAFDGYRIIHISDLHLGSLYGYQDKLRRAINLINNESPDLILFTGDLVNNLAEETKGWEDLLAGLHAPDGNYAILGNHDYGEYYDWPDEKAHQENMQKLIRAHEDSGFTLLLNRSVKISRNDEDIFLAGVENWGLPPFKQYGDLAKALQNIPDAGFTILLSHDPSHWDEEVTDRTGVHLTLSGHTHGMQFGIRIGKFRWSPIQIKYPRWLGFYQQGYQYLHVNPGLGYIGYAGRIGIPPEISLITLKRSTS